MSSFINDLEEKCQSIVRKLKQQYSEPTPSMFVVREMVLLLDRISTIRERQSDLKKRLLEKELYCDSEIMNLKDRPSLKNNWLEQTRLTNEFNQILDRAESQTQRLTVEGETTLHALRLRLLELLNMHDQLSIKHGDTNSTA